MPSVKEQLVAAGAVQGGGGWWTLPIEDENGDPVKVQGASEALDRLESAGHGPEGVAEDPETVARVAQKFVTVQAPPSWARNSWHPAFLTTPLRFDRQARARLLVEQDGQPVEFEFMGPQGPVQVPIADKVAEHPDLEVVA